MTNQTLVGKVIKKSQMTAVVAYCRPYVHKKYGRKFFRVIKIKAHDPKNISVEGEEVRVRLCRPISRDKHWVIEKVKK